MRNGNKMGAWTPTLPQNEFLPYLWGMETDKIKGIRLYTFQFLPYLWGMETLKPQTFNTVTPIVLTVPMRNGNLSEMDDSMIDLTFLPYLWGMETQLRCERLCFSWLVLTVPMRNGNSDAYGVLIGNGWVLTVPMRNGNHIWQSN